jgi:hypothetical protein
MKRVPKAVTVVGAVMIVAGVYSFLPPMTKALEESLDNALDNPTAERLPMPHGTVPEPPEME